MSEKPFWEGKTCEEMANLHVKVTFETGAVVTGITDGSGHIRRSRNGSGVPISANRGAERFVPYRDIESIELLDDPEYERIEEAGDLQREDIAVTLDGNRYKVTDVEKGRNRFWGRVYGAVGPECIALGFDAFDYGLHPKPRLPDHDGLWLDKDDAIWQVCDHQAVPVYDDADEWGLQREVFSVSQLGQYAPFRPAKAVEA